jgi:hypothetical protein
MRHELMPPHLDTAKVQRLARLAAEIDGAYPGLWEDKLAEFNRVAGTNFSFVDLQGIYEAEEHERWVRRVLIQRSVKPAANVTREELLEILRRAMPENGDPDFEAYMAIFDANVPLKAASNLIFYPLDYDAATNTWGGGRKIGEYDPTPEQIVDWALTQRR